MKSLLLGILFIIIVGVGGLVYRNALEYPTQPIACPTTQLACPDGTVVSHIGSSCDFPACPPPNVTLADITVSFALPDGLTASTLPDAAAVAAYTLSANASSTTGPDIIVRRYAINASSTALATIQQTALGGASGAPVNPT